MRKYASLVKLLIFLAISVLIAGYMVVVLADLRFNSTHSYKADFTDVSQLTSGSQVRVAGVEVGKVTGVSVIKNNVVQVSFNVDDNIAMTTSTTATVRYKDLIGNRFLELDPGSGSSTPMKAGGVIPTSQTSAALDLDTLFNGFKPLFVGLTPSQINAVSKELVEVLQGQSGSIYTLLATIASLTSTLADHDQVIGEVIDNLNAVLNTVADNDANLSALIDNLQSVVSGVNGEAPTILNAVVGINSFTASTSSLLLKLNPSLSADLPALRGLSENLNRNSSEVVDALTKVDTDYSILSRLGTYGDFFNIYVCGIRLKLTGSNGQPYLTPYLVQDNIARCD